MGPIDFSPLLGCIAILVAVIVVLVVWLAAGFVAAAWTAGGLIAAERAAPATGGQDGKGA